MVLSDIIFYLSTPGRHFLFGVGPAFWGKGFQ